MSRNTQINLDQIVTREQYITAITALADFAEDILRPRYAWCGERHRYFHAIIGSSYDHGRINTHLVPVDADYNALLRSIRARILWYVRASTCALDDANEGLEYMGLSAWRSKSTEMTRYDITLELSLQMNITGDHPEDWARENLGRIIIEHLDGRKATESPIVPASVRTTRPTYVYILPHDTSMVPDVSETERPSYT